MHRFALRTSIVIASLSAAVLAVGAQSAGIFIGDAGLPAIDAGVSNRTRGPIGRRTLRKVSDVSTGRSDAVAPASVQPGRVLVRFRADAPVSARMQAVRAISPRAVIAPRTPYADFDVVLVDESQNPETVAAMLKTRHAGAIVEAQAEYRAHTMFVPNDPLYRSNQWNLQYLDLERGWDIQPNAGSDITVAVLDTGIAYRAATIVATIPAFFDGSVLYPALGTVTIPYAAADQLVDAAHQNRFVRPFDFIWENNAPLDFDGHGTHVSGTIGQLTNDSRGTAGVAFNVSLMPVKVIDSDWDFLFGAPNFGSDATVARGIRYAADNGARIINMSIGRTAGGPAFAVEEAMRYAVGRGVFIAVAAGNEFDQGNPLSIYAEICSRINGAVSVAAIDRNRAHAPYSTAGSYVELAAPGGYDETSGFSPFGGTVVQQTFHPLFAWTYLFPPSQYRAPRFDVYEYVGFFGTSMASPHVAGAAAILMQQGITSPAAIEDALKRTAIDLGAPGKDNLFGHGLVNVRAAMFGLGAAK